MPFLPQWLHQTILHTQLLALIYNLHSVRRYPTTYRHHTGFYLLRIFQHTGSLTCFPFQLYPCSPVQGLQDSKGNRCIRMEWLDKLEKGKSLWHNLCIYPCRRTLLRFRQILCRRKLQRKSQGRDSRWSRCRCLFLLTGHQLFRG